MARRDFGLRPMRPGDAGMIRRWRNQERVRRASFERAPVSRARHREWIAGRLGHPGRRCWIFVSRGKPYGVVTASLRPRGARAWSWGFYLGRPGRVPRGGRIMGFLALERLFERLGAAVVVGEVLARNRKSAQYHRRLGFTEGKLFARRDSGGRRVAALRFRFRRPAWAVRKKLLAAELFTAPDLGR